MCFIRTTGVMGRFYDEERDPYGTRSARAAVSAALEWEEGFDELAAGWAARVDARLRGARTTAGLGALDADRLGET